MAQYPEVVPPTVVVTAFYPGATPEVIADTGFTGYVSHEWRPTPGRDPRRSIAEAIEIMDV